VRGFDVFSQSLEGSHFTSNDDELNEAMTAYVVPPGIKVPERDQIERSKKLLGSRLRFQSIRLKHEIQEEKEDDLMEIGNYRVN